MKVLTTPQLAETLGLSPKSIHSILSRTPERLPPPIRIPGGRKLLWLEENVLQWLELNN